MGDLGLSSTYAVGAMQQSVRQRIMDALARQQQQFKNDMDVREADRADRALNQQDAYHKLQLQQMADARAATQHQQDFTLAEKFNEAIPAGTTFPTVDRMAAPSQGPVMGRLQMVGALQPTAGTLSSTTDTPANAATGTPPLGRLTAIPEGQIKLPSAGQQNVLADNARADAVAAREAANQPLEDVVDANAPGGHVNVTRAQAVGKTKYNVPAKDTSSTSDANRMDRSYQFNARELESLAKPLQEQAERIGRLRTTINQNTPAADALIAPELLTAMAGGAGSGLRMNEAEIARIVGGRSKWESLKAALNQWSIDPSKALSVTDEQRTEMRTLVKAIADRGQNRLQMLHQAQQGLIDATDVSGHRQTVQKVREMLDSESIGGGTVKMMAPNKQVSDVPADQVEHYKSLGAVVVP